MKINKLFGIFAAGLMLVGGLASCKEDKDLAIAKKAITALGTYTSELKQVSGEVELPIVIVVEHKNDDYTVDLTWTATPADKWTFKTPEEGYVRIKPELPDLDEDPINFTLKVTAQYNEATATKNFSGTLMPTEKSDVITIAEAKVAELGTIVAIQGIIGEARTSKGFYVCDTTGCLYVYTSGSFTDYKVGAEAIVRGERAANTKTVNVSQVEIAQIAYASYELVDSTVRTIPLDSAQNVTIDGVLAWSKDPANPSFVNQANKLYKVNAKIFHYYNAGGSYYIWEMMDANGSYVNFYSVDAESSAYYGYTNYLTQYDGKFCDVYFVVYDINTSGTGNTTWRTVPLHIVPTQA